MRILSVTYSSLTTLGTAVNAGHKINTAPIDIVQLKRYNCSVIFGAG